MAANGHGSAAAGAGGAKLAINGSAPGARSPPLRRGGALWLRARITYLVFKGYLAGAATRWLPCTMQYEAAAPEADAKADANGDAKPDPQLERELVSMAKSQELSAQGYAYDVQVSGLPKPPCQAERVANLAEIRKHMRFAERPEISNIMQLICRVFGTESALVALLDDEDLFVQDSTKIPTGFFPWRKSFCVATLSPASHQTFICENAREDIRFANNELVKAGLVNFYVGSPLISSTGHRIGTLCFTDSKPRAFEAESCQIMNNLAEMVARELERDWVMAQMEERHQQELAAGGRVSPQTPAELLRSMEGFEEAVLFVDVSPPTWTVLLANSAAAAKLGAPPQAFSGAELWKVLRTEREADSALAHLYHDDSIVHGRNFCVPGVLLPGKQEVCVLNFRSAGKDVLAAGDVVIGVPPSVPWTGVRSRFYFATLARQEGGPAAAVPPTVAGLDCVPFDELDVGPVLGRGGFGRVYRGLWRDDTQVAIKVIDDPSTVKMKGGQPVEAVISKDVCHPGIVRVLAHHVAPGQPVWMLTELCDLGTLQDACNRGWFKGNLLALVGTALQVAEALQALHAAGIVHGDLSGANVLLTSAPNPLGWQAKVSDFGLAREQRMQTSIVASRYGNVTHQPPEMLQQGRLSPAADIYAFGVLLWSMYHCSLPWASLNHAQASLPPAARAAARAAGLVTPPTSAHPRRRLQRLPRTRGCSGARARRGAWSSWPGSAWPPAPQTGRVQRACLPACKSWLTR